jgi:hypothetical protein
MIGDLVAIVIAATAFVVTTAFVLPEVILARRRRRAAKTDPLASCIDVPRSTVKTHLPALEAPQTHIYSYTACALAQNYHTSPAAVQALIDDAAAALNCGQPAAAVFVRRALRDYGNMERAAYWLRVEFEYMRLMAQKESSGE